MIFEETNLIVNRNFRDINPLACGRHICDPDYAFGPAVRSYWLLHFVLSGKGLFRTPRGTYQIEKDSLFLIRPYEVTFYQADKEDPWTYIWIEFQASIPLPGKMLSKDVLLLPEFREIFERAFFSPLREPRNRGYEAYLCGKIWETLGILSSGDEEQMAIMERYVAPAMTMMESGMGSGITIEDIASRLHLNRSYFSVIFRKATGKTPKQYLTEIRMEKALQLIKDHGMSVGVTATSVGFPDAFTFSRAFKNHFGISPHEASQIHIERKPHKTADAEKLLI